MNTSIFLLFAIVISCIAHLITKKYHIAVIISSIIITLFVFVVEKLTTEYSDPFFGIAMYMLFGVAFLISILIGIVFLVIRKKKSAKETKGGL